MLHSEWVSSFPGPRGTQNGYEVAEAEHSFRKPTATAQKLHTTLPYVLDLDIAPWMCGGL